MRPEGDPQILRPFHRTEAITIAEAAVVADRSTRTVREWCLLNDLGRRIGGRWAISKVALAMWLDGNKDTLAAYLGGDRSSPTVTRYFARFGVPLPKDLPAMITAELFAKKKPNDRHWYAYDVLVGGETIVSNSRDPEHDLARALLARGIRGVVEIIDGRTGKPRTRINIEKAAKWCVGSNLERYKWKPPEVSDSSPLAGETSPLRIQVREAA